MKCQLVAFKLSIMTTLVDKAKTKNCRQTKDDSSAYPI